MQGFCGPTGTDSVAARPAYSPSGLVIDDVVVRYADGPAERGIRT